MNFVEELKRLDPKDPGRWPFLFRALAILVLFIVLRTAFLTTLETPEPRYVLVCFPALIALGAQVFVRRSAV